MENSGLAKLENATKMLNEIRTVDDAKNLIDLAEAARVYAKQVKLGLEAQNHAAEIKLRAQRKAGEILDSMENNKGGLLRGSIMQPRDETPTYAEMEIGKRDASNWQTIARMPETVFEQQLMKAKTEGEEITTAAMIRTAKHNPGLYSSNSNEWYTPLKILDRVVLTLGQIDLDPCAEVNDCPNVPAIRHFTQKDDGLSKEWEGRIYMNPPYGREITDWIDYLCHQYEIGNVIEAIALIPSRTDTEWFRKLKEFPRCFIWGRLNFNDNENNAPFPSMAVYLGMRADRFIKYFCDIGDIYRAI